MKFSLGDDRIFQDKLSYYMMPSGQKIAKKSANLLKNIALSPNKNAKCIMHNVVCIINYIIYNALCIVHTAN